MRVTPIPDVIIVTAAQGLSIYCLAGLLLLAFVGAVVSALAALIAGGRSDE